METLDELRRRLTGQAYLFDDPASYVAGVEQTLAAMGPFWADGSQSAVAAARPRVGVPPREGRLGAGT